MIQTQCNIKILALNGEKGYSGYIDFGELTITNPTFTVLRKNVVITTPDGQSFEVDATDLRNAITNCVNV